MDITFATNTHTPMLLIESIDNVNVIDFIKGLSKA